MPGVAPARLSAGSEPSYWIYTLLCEESERIEGVLRDAGIGASKLHRPNHLHSVFAPFRRPLPGLDSFYGRLLHLPCGWWVTDGDRQLIVDLIGSACGTR
jgi:dTDP-4-amino-4,6-dideoxygalactose transaminase